MTITLIRHWKISLCKLFKAQLNIFESSKLKNLVTFDKPTE